MGSHFHSPMSCGILQVNYSSPAWINPLLIFSRSLSEEKVWFYNRTDLFIERFKGAIKGHSKIFFDRSTNVQWRSPEIGGRIRGVRRYDLSLVFIEIQKVLVLVPVCALWFKFKYAPKGLTPRPVRCFLHHKGRPHTCPSRFYGRRQEAPQVMLCRWPDVEFYHGDAVTHPPADSPLTIDLVNPPFQFVKTECLQIFCRLWRECWAGLCSCLGCLFHRDC